MAFHNLFDDRVEFCIFRFINDIRIIFSDNGLIRWNFDDVELVNFAELIFLRHGGTGHTGKLFIQPEKVLKGNGGQRFGFTHDVNAFLGFNCLM